LIWAKDGVSMQRWPDSILLSYVFSKKTAQWALKVNSLRVSSELYGWTTTSLDSFRLGNTQF
jgi:hypothetical protein